MSIDGAALLRGLLEHPSPTGDEAGAVAFLVEAMAGLGFDAEIDACGNAVGVLGDGRREILLLGHIDTVPGVIPVLQEGGRLYGRGAVDAKGPLACFVAAAALAGAQPGWRLRVVGAVGEEGDSRGAKFLAKRLSPPEAVIIGEPSGWERICLGYKGTLWLSYAVRRPAGHSAGEAESACEAAARYWQALQAWCAAENADRPRRFDQITPSLTGMQSASDGLSDEARLTINLRLPPGLTVEAATQRLEALGEPGGVQVIDALPAYRSEKNTAPARALLAAIRGGGGQPSFSLKTGTSDMNVVGPAWGAPMLAYGPGDSRLDHAPDEHIDLEEFRRGVFILADALRRMMGSS